MKIKSLVSLKFLFISLAIVGSGIFAFNSINNAEPVQAQTAQVVDTPNVSAWFADQQATRPGNPPDCLRQPGILTGPSYGILGSTRDFNSQDPDCLAAVIADEYGTLYSSDFRYCLEYNGQQSCTGWVSENDGQTTTGPMLGSNGSLSGTMIVRGYRTYVPGQPGGENPAASSQIRPLVCSDGKVPPDCAGKPEGTTMTIDALGVALAYQNNLGPCQGSAGIKWTDGDGAMIHILNGVRIGLVGPFSYGISPSGNDGDNDPGCWQAAMRAHINPAPPQPVQSFTCQVQQTTAQVDAGSGYSYTITTQSQNGFSGPVTFTSNVTPTAGNEPTVTFRQNGRPAPGTTYADVSTEENTPATPYSIVFTGTSGTLTTECATVLDVRASTADFNITIQPISPPIVPNPNRVLAGTNATFQVFIECSGGFNGTISNMTTSTGFTGPSASLASTSVNCGSSTTLTISNTGSAPENQLSTPTNTILKEVRVSGTRAATNPVTKTALSDLAIVKPPTVQLLGNPNGQTGGTSSVNITVGSTVHLNWTTDAVNPGNSCTATNSRTDGAWVGPKNGPYGGSQLVGPFTTTGTFTYTIQCTGFNNIQSAPSTVTINVGGAPYYTCNVTPQTQTVSRGSNGVAAIDVTSFNNYNSPVTFTASVTPANGTPPIVTFIDATQDPPYSDSDPARAIIQTFADTTAASYQITFTGTGGISCASSITFEVEPNTPSSSIFCNTDSLGPCEVASGGESTIRWVARNVNQCTVTKSTASNPTRVFWDEGFPKTRSSGAITENTSFYLNCTGIDGPAPEKHVDLIVRANPNPSVNLTCSSTENGTYGPGPCIVANGAVGYMKWTSQYTTANSCSINNNIGGVAPNNTVTGRATNAITGPVTYTITCNGASGTTPATDSVLFDIEALPGQPEVDLKCRATNNGPSTNGPCTVASGTRGNMTWTSSNIDTCVIDNSIGTVETSNERDGRDTNIITGTVTYTISCRGPGGEDSDSVEFRISVVPPVFDPPFVDLKCATSQYGSASDGPCVVPSGTRGNMTWTTKDATTCSIDQNIGGVELNNTGAGRDTDPITTTITYTLTCSGPGGVRSDSVEFRIEPLPPEDSDFFISCTPASIMMLPGGSGTYRLRTTKIGAFNSRINFEVKTLSPSTANMPTVTIDQSTNNLVPPNETLANVSTDGNTTPEVYVIVFEGSTPKGVKKECRVELEVKRAPDVNPNPPSVSTDNSQCGKVAINWSPVGLPTPTGYIVYRGNNSDPDQGSWADISGLLPASQRSFVDTSAAPSNNYYKVIAYNGSAQSGPQNPAILGNVRLCQPDNSRSDKDLVSVTGVISKNFDFMFCNATSDKAELGANIIFSAGDKVRFRINVCNSGEGTMTGVYVVDTLKNLKDVTDVQSNCGVGYTPGAVPIRFNLPDIAPGNVTLQSCKIEFTATINAPATTTSGVYRFQNIADIYSNELPVRRVFTPPYPFSVTGGVPDRNETAPQ